MKKIIYWMVVGCFTITILGCSVTATTDEDKPSAGQQAFEKNSKSVMDYINAWENEDVDYDRFFAQDYESWGTAFGDSDTTRLEQMKESNQRLFNAYDFKVVTDPINLLPGVDNDTKEIDGSVRVYYEWAITKTATDSTEAKTGNLKMYQAYVFNDEGKITLHLTYGDFGGLLDYLNSED